MSKLGVIQVIDTLSAGGAEVLAINIANGLAENKINSHICSTRKKGILINNINKNVGTLFLQRKKVVDFFAIIKFIEYIKKNKVTIIHAHSTSYFFAFCVKLLYPKVKIFWHDHYGKSIILNSRKIYPLKLCSFFFESIISVNTDLKIWAEKKLKCNKVYFINNFAEFTNTNTITKLKGIEGKRIVHLAAFREQKDHLNLLKAFKIVIKTYPDYTLHLVGEIKDNQYSIKVKKFIKDKHLENNVYLYGACLDIKNILNQSSIGVLSSESEGLPVSLLEYGLAKLPVLITDVGECKNVINNNAIVIAKNSNAFAESLIKIIGNDVLRKEISLTLNNNIIRNFSKEIFISKIKKLYLNI